MKNSVSFLFLILLLNMFSSCKEEVIVPPVSLDKMKMVFLDLQLAESYSQGLDKDTVQIKKFQKNYDSLTAFYESIFQHHDMNLEQFESYYTWFKDHPVYMDSVLNLVLEEMSLEKVEREIKSLDPEEKKKNDSSVIPLDSGKNVKSLDIPKRAPDHSDIILKEAQKELEEIRD